MKLASLLLLSCSIVCVGSAAKARPAGEMIEVELEVAIPDLQLDIFGFHGIDDPLVGPDGDWWLNAAASQRVAEILLHYSYMPELFQLFRARNDYYWRVVLRASLAVVRAEHGVDLAGAAVTEAARWSWWEMGLIVGAALLLGAAVGLGVGYAAGSGPVVIR